MIFNDKILMQLANRVLKELKKPFYLMFIGIFGITYVTLFFSIPLILGVLR